MKKVEIKLVDHDYFMKDKKEKFEFELILYLSRAGSAYFFSCEFALKETARLKLIYKLTYPMWKKEKNSKA